MRPRVFGRHNELPVPSRCQGTDSQQGWIPTEQSGGDPVHLEPHRQCENADARA